MYRLIWISGRFGGHKTALAFRIAEDYLKKGYKLITNTKSVWNEDLSTIELNKNNHLKAVVLLDEGGLYFKAGRQVEQIAAYAAKMDCLFLFPSFFPPTKAAQVLTIQPVISLKATGLPVIIYKWSVSIGQFREKGWFAWWNPKEIYGIYSRQDPGDEPEEIIQFLSDKSNEYRARYGRKSDNRVLSLETLSEGDKILEASDVLSQSFDGLETVFNRKRGKR